MIIMSGFEIVEIECYDEKKNQRWRIVGRLREGANHVALISGWTESADLYTYTVIPKAFVRRVKQLKVE